MPNTHLAGFCLKPKKIFFNNLGNLNTNWIMDNIRDLLFNFLGVVTVFRLCFEKENRTRVLET